MPQTLETRGRGGEGGSKQMAFGPVLLILAAIEFAFLFALVTRLNWQGGGLVVLVATGLAGGAVFTALEMHRLGKKDR